MSIEPKRPSEQHAFPALDIAALKEGASVFAGTLAAAKSRISPTDFAWYPYDTLSNLVTIDRLLSGEHRFLLQAAADKPILDIGCADGDLAFYLESLGCAVQALDNPVTNFNSMRGLRALKADLGSSVEILEADLDSQFRPPHQRYGLVLLLGVLYHVKNPYFLLETLSGHAEHCLISTLITEHVPGLYDAVTGTAVAYLADVYEVNQDSTNYWLFSDAGFRRLLARCNWEICDYLLTGDGSASDSTGRIGGQRAFCLARSKFAAAPARVLYGRGWHLIEQGGWRWTERQFSIRVESSQWPASKALRMKVYVPDSVLARFHKVRLHALVNGVPLPLQSYSEPGSHEYFADLTAACRSGGDLRVDFWLDDALPPEEQDQRERGIVVSAVEILT